MLQVAVTVLLICVRLLAISLTAPLLGHRTVGMGVRLVIAASLGVVVSPLIPPVEGLQTPTLILRAVLGEAFVGAFLGFGMSVIFASATMAGGILGQMAGLQLFGDALGTGDSGSPVQHLFGIVSIALFASLGGIELVVGSVLNSYAALPAGGILETTQWLELLKELLHQSFLLVIRCVAPGVAAILVASYLVGMLQKSFPAMGSMGLGLSSNLVLMLLAVFLTLGGITWLLIDDLERTTDWLHSALGRMAAD